MKIIGVKIRAVLLFLLAGVIFQLPHLLLAEEVSEKFDLKSYPQETKVVISLDEGIIVPAKLLHYRGKADSEVTVFRAHEATIKKGEHWATIEKERLDFEERNLAIARRKYVQDVDQLHQKQKEAIAAKEESMEKLMEGREKLLSLMDHEELTSKMIQRVKLGIDKLDGKMADLEESSSEEKMNELLELEEETLKLALDRSEKDFIRNQKRAILKASFDGKLELANKVPKGDPPYNIDTTAGELFATISNSSYYEVQISNKNPLFQRKELSNLALTIRVGREGDLINATYKERRKEEVGNITKDIHVFEVDTDSVELAVLALDENRVCQIIEILPEPCYIVSKSDIALLKPKVLREGGWRGVVKALWPEAKLVVEGPYGIAVSTKP